MATQTRSTAHGLVPYRLTVEQFTQLVDAGVFSDCARVELLKGRLFATMTKNHPHDFAVCELGDDLRRFLPEGFLVREEKSFEVGQFSRVEPDLVVLRGPNASYRARAPRAEDVLLVIEVADSTYAKDRGPMWRLYAEANIPVYWIVNISKRVVEVYGSPAGRGRAAAYGDAAVFGQDDEVPVVIEGREVGRVGVKTFLP